MEFAPQDRDKRWIWGIFAPVLAGFLFSGYLSAVKFFSNTCAFGETCPYFLGYPACWYGFAMYVALLVSTVIALPGGRNRPAALKANIGISAIGILFAGSLVIEEFAKSTITGTLGLSTCAYGLIFYVIVFALSISAFRKTRAANAG